jgi:cell division protein ZapA
MPPEKQPVRITILGQEYTLLSSGSPREVIELAQEVDDLMLSIARRQPNADSTRVAVLACLHLADRLHTLKQHVDRKSEEFASLLGKVLEE